MNGSASAEQLLIIDPCAETQARIARYAANSGFSVIAVADPAAALVKIQEAAPALVITDMFLPDGAGLALAKELKARHEPCPVIVMANQAPEPLIVDALRGGAVDYLHKPVAEDELMSVLQRVQDFLPCHPMAVPGARHFSCELTVDSDPAHIPDIISWLLRMTASAVPSGKRMHIQGALQELLFNAVEHGNLEIQGQDKQQALAEGCYEQLVAARLAQPRLSERRVTIHVRHERSRNCLEYRITDEGQGFPWRTALARSQEVFDFEGASGRGIFLTKAFFPSLSYNEQGNEVTITVPLE